MTPLQSTILQPTPTFIGHSFADIIRLPVEGCRSPTILRTVMDSRAKTVPPLSPSNNPLS